MKFKYIYRQREVEDEISDKQAKDILGFGVGSFVSEEPDNDCYVLLGDKSSSSYIFTDTYRWFKVEKIIELDRTHYHKYNGIRAQFPYLRVTFKLRGLDTAFTQAVDSLRHVDELYCCQCEHCAPDGRGWWSCTNQKHVHSLEAEDEEACVDFKEHKLSYNEQMKIYLEILAGERKGDIKNEK